ncbi:MAG: type II toxin-antitoxin system RelE/ParE family toxin [Parcubacteria group bacterium]
MANRYTVYISKSVRRSIKKIAKSWQRRVIRALIELEKEPFLGARMRGQMEGRYKIRIWPYRIIYKVDMSNKVIEVLEVGHRGNISYD